MTITNNLNLPQSLVNACGVEEHSKEGCISCTELLKGAKQTILTHRHWDELEDDVSDRIWALLGTTGHKLLEEKNPGAFTEQRFEFKVGDKTVTGQVDLFNPEEKTLVDYKFTSAYKVMFKNFDDWRKQGLVYAFLMKQNGVEVKKCSFIAMLRDWSKTEAKRNADYPQAQVYEYSFDVTPEDLEVIEAYIRHKVDEVCKAEKLADDDIEPCSAEERWQRESKFVVMREGRKTAVRVLDDKVNAEIMAQNLGGNHFVVERKGESVRCSSYCSCCEFCNFYKEHCKPKEDASEAA